MTATLTGSRVVMFRVGRDLFATDVLAVERVTRYQVPRQVPNLPSWIEGIVELDGRVVPVVDLRRRLGVPALEGGMNPAARLLLLSVEDQWCALVVDQVLDVRAHAAEDVAPPPPLVRDNAGALVLGTLRRGDDLALLLDVIQLFSPNERADLRRAHA